MKWGLNIAQKATAVATTVTSTAMTMLGFKGKSVSAVMKFLAISFKNVTVSATALKFALRCLLIASGVGAAIWAATEVIGYFANASDKATNSTNKLLDAEERAKRTAEQMERLKEQENSLWESNNASLQLNIAKLKEFNGTKEQEKHDLIYDAQGNKKKYSTKSTKRAALTRIDRANLPEDAKIDNSRGIATIPSDLDRVHSKIRVVNGEIQSLKKQMSDAVKEANATDFSVKGTDTPQGHTAKIIIAKGCSSDPELCFLSILMKQ